MTPESPRELLVRLGAQLQSIASRREAEGAIPDAADAILWMTGPDGATTFVSRAWSEYTGLVAADAGRTAAIHADDRERARRVFEAAVAAREPFAVDYRLRRNDGAYRWVLDSGRPRHAPGGGYVGHLGSVLDVHELSLAVEERNRLMHELEQADRRKDEFLATLAHELRNPLAPLRHALQVLRLADQRGGTAAPLHEMMERQIGHLVRLVDDLLEVSRITHGTFELRRACVDLALVVRNAVETSSPLIDAARHRLDVLLPREPVQVEGDAVRLTQVLANLLNNAARYTPEGGEISVTLRREADAASISVRDSGRGIAPELAPRLFEMFSRGEDSGGLGIGLALSRRLVEMHGGEIRALSDGAGKGSEFTVRLPFAGAKF